MKSLIIEITTITPKSKNTVGVPLVVERSLES